MPRVTLRESSTPIPPANDKTGLGPGDDGDGERLHRGYSAIPAEVLIRPYKTRKAA